MSHRCGLSFLLLALSSVFAAAAPPPRLEVPELAFEKVTLPNGLQLILHVDRKLPLVHVNLWYHVGSKNEKPGRTGFAHLFEHMMLQGSKNEPENFFSFMDRIGATKGRNSNGTTYNDRTSYFSTAPSGSLELMLWLHADLLATLPEALTQQKLDNQRGVVRNERREHENVPYGDVEDLLSPALFPPPHPYAWPVIGSHADLMAASLDDVKDFFRTYYAPNNLSLTITGDFDPAQARALVEKYFGTIPPGPPIARPVRDVPVLTEEKIFDVTANVPAEKLYLAYLAPPLGAPGEAELEVASTVLASGLTSRLIKTLVVEQRLCSGVDTYLDSRELASVFFIEATARPGVSLERVRATLDRELARLAQTGPTAAELRRAKNQLLNRAVTQMQDIGAFGGQGDMFNHANVYFGDPGAYRAQLGRRLDATPQGVRQAVARWLGGSGRVMVRYHPSAAAAPTAEIDRSKMPAPGVDRPFPSPEVVADKLDNGLEIFVVERHDLSAVSVSWQTRAGSAFDPPGKAGLARLTASLLSRGTRTRSAAAIDDAFADLGVTLNSGSDRDVAAQTISVLKPNLAPALDLLGDVIRRPTFPEAEVARERDLVVDALTRTAKEPPAIARRLRDTLIFGPTHPYGATASRASVAALGRAELAAFHAAAYRPATSVLFFVGDITPAEARALAQRAFGDWSGEAAPPPVLGPPAPPARGKVVIVDQPGAPQTYIMKALGAPPSKEPDYYAWYLATTCLSNRVYANLRQDKGYSYGIFSFPALYASAMGWFISGGVQSDKTRESIVEVEKEVADLGGRRPITAEELQSARLENLRALAARFVTTGDVAAQLAALWQRRWPMATIAEMQDGLAKATLADVQAAAKKYAVPRESTLLLVGDRATLVAALKTLGMNDVVVWDAEGKTSS